ncbi:MAG: DUF134 domain-containing protein, partial [Candidatus Bathycorpusculaceae bacterium]
MSGWQWRRRRRHGRVGRPPKPIAITINPATEKLEPTPKKSLESIYLEPAEIEALRLIDLEKLSFEEAGERMMVSRNTVWRLVESAREKLIRAIFEGREI